MPARSITMLVATSLPHLQAHKMYQCLQEYQDSRLNELVSSFSHSDLEQRTVEHLRATIAAAIDHYHMWQARRNSQFR